MTYTPNKETKKEIANARAILKFHGVKGNLLAKANANPKVEKNMKLGVMTAPLHFSPEKLSGFNVCPMATAGCKAACLHTAGNPAYKKAKYASRLAKTKAFFNARDEFMKVLVHEIYLHVNRCEKANFFAAVRLNATSDIRWEVMPVTIGGVTYDNVMELFPNVDFYDYTKIANRRNLPFNYTLTFSLAENNDTDALKALDNGLNVAVVFNTKRTKELPTQARFVHTSNGLRLVKTQATFSRSFDVIDGDEHDYRPADPRGVIVGLRAKGDAMKDASGFVRQDA